MEHIKDLLNFKENKKYKIIIMVLLIIIIFMQTGLSFTKKKIRFLTENIKTLNEQLSENTRESYNAGNDINNIDDLITDKEEDNNINVEYQAKNELVNRFKEIGKQENKIYKSSIIDGEKYLVFETVNLEMTDNQIKSTFKNLTKDEFGIEITESKLGDDKFFKIYLIENPGS